MKILKNKLAIIFFVIIAIFAVSVLIGKNKKSEKAVKKTKKVEVSKEKDEDVANNPFANKKVVKRERKKISQIMDDDFSNALEHIEQGGHIETEMQYLVTLRMALGGSLNFPGKIPLDKIPNEFFYDSYLSEDYFDTAKKEEINEIFKKNKENMLWNFQNFYPKNGITIYKEYTPEIDENHEVLAEDRAMNKYTVTYVEVNAKTKVKHDKKLVFFLRKEKDRLNLFPDLDEIIVAYYVNTEKNVD